MKKSIGASSYEDEAASMFDLRGRKALVTGASSGIGRNFALTLARAGAEVIVAARRIERLDDLVREIDVYQGRSVPAMLDVTDAASVKKCFDMIESSIGTVDVIVNCAGVTSTGPVLQQREQDWDAVIDTNLKGAWLVAQEGARRMVSAGIGGSIVNVASILGERVAGGVTPYAASKAGLIHLTKSLALELARYRIRVNALAPGYIATELNSDFLSSEPGQRLMARVPQRRFGQLENLDGPLLLLASNAGEYMTGSVIAVDGGHLCSSL